MKKRFLILLMAATGFCLGTMAEKKQTLTINGSAVEKTVTKITFDNDMVVLSYDGETTESFDMEAVTISFEDIPSAISDIKTYSYKRIVNGMITVGNIESGASIAIYNASGKQMFAGRSNGTSFELSIENLPNGMYLLKVDNEIVKFVKR